ncbi:MAG TPA: glycosyltransferase family 9 protein [Vulgatibacter sp.]
MRILVIRTSALGDTILATPVLRALRRRYPDAEIHFVTQPAWAPLFDGVPFVTRVWRWTMGGGRRTLRGIPSFAASLRRSGTFDLVVDLQNSPMVRLLLAGVRPRRTIRFVKRRTVSAVVSSIFGEGPVLDELPNAALYLEALGSLGFPTHAAARRGIVPLPALSRPRTDRTAPDTAVFAAAAGGEGSVGAAVAGARMGTMEAVAPGAPGMVGAGVIGANVGPAEIIAPGTSPEDSAAAVDSASATAGLEVPVDDLPPLPDPVTGWDLRPAIHLSPEALGQADTLLADARGAPVVALAPGGRWATKRWPPERFAQVGNALSAAGARIVLVGGPADRAELKAVAAALVDPPLGDTAALDVAGLAAVIAKAGVLVSCDSAPNHLAQAVGTPSITVFGPTSARRWGPLPGAGASISLPIGCAPCSNFGKRPCHLGHHACMQDLGPEAVIAAALAALREGRMSGGPAAGIVWSRERVGLAMQVARSRREVRRR